MLWARAARATLPPMRGQALPENDRPLAHASALAATALVVWLLFRGSFGNGFWADDFLLLLRSQKTGFLEILSRDLLGDFAGEQRSSYWRPGWFLLLKAMHVAFGVAERPYFVAGVVLHLLLAFAVYAVLARLGCRAPAAALGALLFATAPDQLEGVLWMSAWTCGIPCALLVLASGVGLLAYLERGRKGDLALSLACFGASFLFKEAGYHLALLAIVGPLALGRYRARSLLVALPFVAVVLAHNVLLNKFSVSALSPGETAAVAFANLCQMLRRAAGFGGGEAVWIVLAAAAALAPVVWLTSRAEARFFLLWAIVALFPYVAVSPASRFVYFAHAPLAIGVTLWVCGLVGPGRKMLGWVILCGAVGVGILRLTRHVGEYREHGEVCRSAIASVRDAGVESLDVVRVDTLPPELEYGLDAALELYLGKPVAVVPLRAFRRAPFLIHWSDDFDTAGAGPVWLRWDQEALRYSLVTKQELLGGLVPMHAASLRFELVVISDQGAMQRELEARRAELGRTVLLAEEPGTSVGPRPETRGTVAARYDSVASLRFDVDTPTTALLVISLPYELVAHGGRATIDGNGTKILRANGSFNAIVVPAGRHVVRVTVV
jgi:hypothetical protein